MKKEYNLKDTVWIHIGERVLTEGRIVEVIDLEHLGEGHSKDDALYVIELKTGIEDTYEVRSYEQISPDAAGPIALFRNKEKREEAVLGNRYMKNIGIVIPATYPEFEEAAESEPTPDQIHAALERSQQAVQHEPLATTKKPKPKYVKRRPKKV